MKLKQYVGILLGGLYGFIYRWLCETDPEVETYFSFNIYSISFLWIMPFTIGLIPMFFAREEMLKSRLKQFLFPFLSVLLFCSLCLSSGLEDWLCVMIISFPSFVAAGVSGLLMARYLKTKPSKKLYSIVLLPLIISPLEGYISNTQETFEMSSSLVVDADQPVVWSYLIEVPEIDDTEFSPGFYNTIGVPRPIKSELTTMDGQVYRIGYFTEGLELYETIAAIDQPNYVEFKIHLDQSKLRDLPTDQHLLNSNYFSFENISYSLLGLENGQTRLTLNCTYLLNSKMNGYANFWAKRVIKDFEERLLNALQLKIERETSGLSNHPPIHQ